jgi:toxin ParE1/3/4
MGPDVRSFVVGKYVVFYRIAPGGIDVGRIVHGARNVAPEDI